MTDVRIVLLTAPSAEVADEIATALVSEQLIACGNVTTPISSVYTWDGKTERATEVLVIMKTTQDALPEVIRRARELHPYEVPEIIALEVQAGLDAYLDWVRASSSGLADK